MRPLQRLGMSVGLAAVIAATGGCASIRDHRGYVADRVLIESVQPGIDNRQSVERTLGRPTFVSEFGQKDWYYVSINTKQAPFSRPRTEDQQVLRIRFDDAGNVASLDKRGKEQVVRISPYGGQTPTLGRKRGLLQDLFGNIGAVGTGGTGAAQSGPQGGGPNGS
jgi:outer membrane protein assembly factor BamE (lipoprotein component of BamABCDE complex)